jgi:hypothetical protein
LTVIVAPPSVTPVTSSAVGLPLSSGEHEIKIKIDSNSSEYIFLIV